MSARQEYDAIIVGTGAGGSTMALDLTRRGMKDISISETINEPGWSEHESAACRMGRDPKTSVCNGFGQTHEVKNLFVADGGLFTQSSEKSPTVTIMAMALRGADYLADQYKQGNL